MRRVDNIEPGICRRPSAWMVEYDADERTVQGTRRSARLVDVFLLLEPAALTYMAA